mmetsp:Transcript_32047/g.75533  ORF Transcript_32047/g.75533 Transcript_32047/m.75533 type:complete len:327 (-) Transcript_32047:47-1027(-)
MKWQHCMIYAERIKKDSGWNAKSYPGVGVGSDYNTELEEKLIEKLISELGGIKRDVAVRLLIAANRTVERAVGNHQLALAHHYAGQDKCDSTAEELSEDDKDMKDVYILAKSLDVDEHGASALLEAAGWNLARANAAVNRAQIRLDEEREAASRSKNEIVEERPSKPSRKSSSKKVSSQKDSKVIQVALPRLRTGSRRSASSSASTSAASSAPASSSSSFTASPSLTPSQVSPAASSAQSPSLSPANSRPASIREMPEILSDAALKAEPPESMIVPSPISAKAAGIRFVGGSSFLLGSSLGEGIILADCCFVKESSADLGLTPTLM